MNRPFWGFCSPSLQPSLGARFALLNITLHPFLLVFPSPLLYAQPPPCVWFIIFCEEFIVEDSIFWNFTPQASWKSQWFRSSHLPSRYKCRPSSFPSFAVQSKRCKKPFMHSCRKPSFTCKFRKGVHHTVRWNVVNSCLLTLKRVSQKGKNAMALEYLVLSLKPVHSQRWHKSRTILSCG